MLTYASRYGLRIIAMNLRDYQGSMPCTTAEIAELSNPGPAAQVSAVREFGKEISGFMMHVCTTLAIPAIQVVQGKKTGGLVILGWSMSTIAINAILGDSRSLREHEKRVLSLYVRKAIYHGKSC